MAVLTFNLFVNIRSNMVSKAINKDTIEMTIAISEAITRTSPFFNHYSTARSGQGGGITMFAIVTESEYPRFIRRAARSAKKNGNEFRYIAAKDKKGNYEVFTLPSESISINVNALDLLFEAFTR